MRAITHSAAIDTPETLIDGAVRKAKSRLVPMIIIMYLIAYIDRANLGFAALRMNADLNLTPDLFGFAAGIFYGRLFRALDPRLRQTEIGRLHSVVFMCGSRADRSDARRLLAVR